MKIRIASSIALAATIALGATGCGLVAPQGSTDPYSPSDGRDVNIEVQVPAEVLENNGEFVRDPEAATETRNVDVRNIILVPDETGENLNVVFTAVNSTTEAQQLAVTFTAEDTSAVAMFDLPVGTTSFGDPEGKPGTVQLITLPKKAGDMVSVTYELSDNFGAGIEIFCAVTDPTIAAGTAVAEGEADAGCYIPVLDTASDAGTGLAEYAKYVLPADFQPGIPQIFNDEQEGADAPAADEDAKAGEKADAKN